MKKSGKKHIALFMMVPGLILALVLYLLADRYLIEHVQIRNANALTGSTTGTSASNLSVAAGTSSDEPGSTTVETGTTAEGAVNASTESGTTTAGTTAVASDSTAVAKDDWNYQGSTSSITVRKVVTGTGNDTVTYYVADVTVSDATVLASAFAKNQFGTNIIEAPSAIASANNAIFAINGDYYGFREDGIVIRNGVIFRDSPARTGLAFYLDGTMKVYDETSTSAQELLDAGVWNTLSFGPAIVENAEIPAGIDQVEVDTNFGNHSIQGNQPRTGVGIIDANHFVFLVADGRSPGYSKGVTMTEFARIFKQLGCTTAYNIDGGGSSTMYFNGRVVNNPLGRSQERGTSDILFIAEDK